MGKSYLIVIRRSGQDLDVEGKKEYDVKELSTVSQTAAVPKYLATFS